MSLCDVLVAILGQSNWYIVLQVWQMGFKFGNLIECPCRSAMVVSLDREIIILSRLSWSQWICLLWLRVQLNLFTSEVDRQCMRRRQQRVRPNTIEEVSWPVLLLSSVPYIQIYICTYEKINKRTIVNKSSHTPAISSYSLTHDHVRGSIDGDLA